MSTEDMILANEFCVHHDIDLAFIYSLQHSGLVEIILIEEKVFLPTSQLPQLERLVRLYHELDINLAGLETTTHLLLRLDTMQQQITKLKARLSLYETE